MRSGRSATTEDRQQDRGDYAEGIDRFASLIIERMEPDRRYVRYTAMLSTSVAGRNPPDWWAQSDA